jgi:hypothetical protein
MAAIRINYVTGTARCAVHGEEPCDHMDRLARRLGAMAYHLDKRYERDTRTGIRGAHEARDGAGTLHAARAILASVLERPLAARPDESPL